MLNKKLFLIVHLFLLPLFTHAKIIKHKQLKKIHNYIKKSEPSDTLVIFDIDNTLAETVLLPGSDQWFYFLITDQKQYGLTEQQAIDNILPLYHAIRNKAELKLTENTIPSIFKRLHNNNVQTIGLTAQGAQLEHQTTKELKRLGVNFHNTITTKNFIDLELGTATHYNCGILFSEGRPKGRVLQRFFDLTHYKPQKIIFIDDKLHNLENVQKYAKHHGIEFIGIHYTRLSKKVEQFDTDKAKDQLKKNYPDLYKKYGLPKPGSIDALPMLHSGV